MTHPILRMRSRRGAITAYVLTSVGMACFMVGFAPFLALLVTLISLVAFVWLVP